MAETPKIGLGIIIEKDGKILVGKRKNAHAPFYSIPGGHLEIGETFEQGAIREIKEECGIMIKNPQVIGLTNNMTTYKNEGKHYISIVLFVKEFEGQIKNMEPEKCEERIRVDPRHLPMPHFDASQMAIENYTTGRFYKKFF